MPSQPAPPALSLDQGHAPEIIGKAMQRGVLRNQLAYILATARWETAHTMKPVREAFWLSEGWRRRNLTRYYPYYGRGFAQLTWDYNYRRAGEALGIGDELVEDPDRALEPEIAAEVLIVGMMEGWYNARGHGLGHYVTLTHSDYVQARRTVNILDKAGRIALLAEAYEDLLLADGYGVDVPEETEENASDPPASPIIPDVPVTNPGRPIETPAPSGATLVDLAAGQARIEERLDEILEHLERRD
jgi:hypothetical protein